MMYTPSWCLIMANTQKCLPVFFALVSEELEFTSYDVQHFEYPDRLDEVDAYLITGSKSSVYENKGWIEELKRFVVTLDSAKKKTVGICFGHQIVAHALGGKTVKSPNGWHIGNRPHHVRNTIEWTKEDTNDFRLLFSHQDEVVVPAKGSSVLASTEKCAIAMCSVGDHMLTIQGHPEFEIAYARQLIDMRKDQYGTHLYEESVATLEISDDKQLIANLMLDFMRFKNT